MAPNRDLNTVMTAPSEMSLLSTRLWSVVNELNRTLVTAGISFRQMLEFSTLDRLCHPARHPFLADSQD
jgi:hypothetical protein